MTTGDTQKFLRAVAYVGVAYAVTGKLGLLLALPPGYATAIWPPSGVALSGVLLLGPQACAGVFLGSFAVNLSTGLDATTASTIAKSIALAAAIGAGAALEAAVGAALIRRVVGFPTALKEAPEVLRFSLLGGPVACLVNALVGPTSLFVAGAFAAKDFLVNALNWWAGDVLGVIVVVPIVLSFAGEPRSVWRARRLTVAGPMAAVFAIAIVAYVRASALEQRALDQEFRERATALERALSSRIDAHMLMLEQTRDLFSASDVVEREEFSRFVRPSLGRLPGIQAIEWVAAVRVSDVPAYQAALAHDGFGGVALHDFGVARPPGDDGLVYPVTFIEPLRDNERALALDVASEQKRRVALEQARDTGGPVASEGVELLGHGLSLGVLIFSPVYRTASEVTTVEGRRANLNGFVLGVFRMKDLVAAALGPASFRDIAVNIRDAASGVLYSEAFESARSTLRFSTPIEVGERQWTFEFSSKPAYSAIHQTWEAWALLASAVAFGGLLGAFLLVLTGRAAEFEQRTREMTELLSTLVQSSQDAIVAYDPSGLVVSWNQGAAIALGLSEAEAVGHDAHAFVPPSYFEEHARNLQRVFGGENLPAYESVRLAKGGARLDVAVKLSPVRDAAGGVQAVSEICRDVTAAKEADQRLRTSLREKELLLKEVHHRVKNNLQVISSLLNLQAQHVADPAHRSIFTDSQSRVQSIALVHEKLYQSKDLAHVDFAEYVRILVSGLFHAQNHSERGIRSCVDVGATDLTVDVAIPCGLIINELVTNALKHTFPTGTTGQVRVALNRADQEWMELVVEDDGRGLPEGLDPRHTTSLGLDLVFTFAEQLDANVEIERTHGTAFRFRFPRPSVRAGLDA